MLLHYMNHGKKNCIQVYIYEYILKDMSQLKP